ncbi:MAG TPA: hypothetical protein H9734_01025 [Candidatus Fusicatenibacter merdavium]|uniref:Uncharacterized protein n=1 Tax=Candidatus Fusicatenibacter merdavium TaxID=2838600 RepID=A0A9D1XBR0_9FIRM|nr:hypothetical protein [Candidatus Fusicatenibacter merdavium]
MIVNYLEINNGRKERILPTEISDIAMLQFRAMMPKALEGMCEMQYGTGFRLEIQPGKYRVDLSDVRGEEPLLLAVSMGVWEENCRLDVWKTLHRMGVGKRESGKILDMPPAVPYIVDWLLPPGEARRELDPWRRNFTQGLGWTIFEMASRI